MKVNLYLPNLWWVLQSWSKHSQDHRMIIKWKFFSGENILNNEKLGLDIGRRNTVSLKTQSWLIPFHQFLMRMTMTSLRFDKHLGVRNVQWFPHRRYNVNTKKKTFAGILISPNNFPYLWEHAQFFHRNDTVSCTWFHVLCVYVDHWSHPRRVTSAYI